MIKIVYACNNEMFDGLYLSILSILRRSKETFAFYLLTADFSSLDIRYNKMDEIHEEALVNLVKSYNPKNTFTIIDCKEEYDQCLKGNKNEKSHYSPYSTLRLLIGKYKELTKGKVIYLDVDTMANGDIKEMYDVELADNDFAVVHDCLGRYWQHKDCFNSGVILFNMDVAMKDDLFDKCIKCMHEKKMYFPDQSALNLSNRKFMFFPGNERRYNYQRVKMEPDTLIKHFCARIRGWPLHNNIKQWDQKGVHRYLHIHAFDEDYKIFNEYKAKLKEELRDKYFIKVNHLKKRYGDLKAVDDISFKVKKGSLFAFLGINGAGKSTTINIISSTLQKDSGEINIDSYDLDKEGDEIKNEIGIVFQNSTLDDILSVEENLRIRGKFYRMKKDELNKSIERVSKMLNLEPILHQAVGKLSGGQKRRVDIARALLHEPKLLMLDEPTTGLDPKTRLDVWRLIDEIRRRTKMTVFLTTHYLEEAEKATYVVIMNKGKIIAEGTPNELKNLYSSDMLIVYKPVDKKFEKELKGHSFRYEKDADAYFICVKDSEDAKKLLSKFSKDITDFEIKKGNMDDVFLNVTGNK